MFKHITICMLFTAIVACGSQDEPGTGPVSTPAPTPTPQPTPEQTPPTPQPAPEAQPAQPTGAVDPRATAIAILDACRGSDPAVLRPLATSSNADEIPQPEAGQSLCAAIFGVDSWRNQAVTAWDGQIQAVRRDGERARALFHAMEGDEVAVVAMKLENDQWRFDDINSPSRADFDGWGQPVE